jgi:hypothetical protein
MGNFISSLFPESETKTLLSSRLSVAQKRLTNLINSSWSWGGVAVWTTVTAAVVLVVPVFFEYERECQLFEQMQQAQAAQIQAAEQAAVM